jgi:hypothetical protein
MLDVASRNCIQHCIVIIYFRVFNVKSTSWQDNQPVFSSLALLHYPVNSLNIEHLDKKSFCSLTCLQKNYFMVNYIKQVRLTISNFLALLANSMF